MKYSIKALNHQILDEQVGTLAHMYYFVTHSVQEEHVSPPETAKYVSCFLPPSCSCFLPSQVSPSTLSFCSCGKFFHSKAIY